MSNKRNIMFIFIVITILSFELYVFSHTQFTLWPEMVLYPWLYNKGFLLYREIINPYFPLLNWTLGGLTKILGYDLRVFIIFTWGYIILTQLIFALVVHALFHSKKITLVSLVFYVVLLVIFEGNGLWFDLFCTLPLLGAYCFLTKKESWQKYLIAGVCLGIGILIKQTVIWTIVLLIFYLLLLRVIKILNTKHLILNTFILISPIVTMVIGVGLIFYFQGIFNDFFFWSIKLPFGTLQKTPGFVEWPTKRSIILMVIIFYPLIIYISKIIRDRRLTLAFIFFASTFLFAFPRFGYFHLVTCIPFFALITARIFADRPIGRAIYMTLISYLLIVFIKKNTHFSIRFFDPAIYEIAKDIRRLTQNDGYFLQNAPQQIYFINDSLPTKPWAINFPWYFEKTSLQQRVVTGIKNEKIKWIVFEKYLNDVNRYFPGTYSPYVLDTYLIKNYQLKQKIRKNLLLLKLKK